MPFVKRDIGTGQMLMWSTVAAEGFHGVIPLFREVWRLDKKVLLLIVFFTIFLSLGVALRLKIRYFHFISKIIKGLLILGNSLLGGFGFKLGLSLRRNK